MASCENCKWYKELNHLSGNCSCPVDLSSFPAGIEIKRPPILKEAGERCEYQERKRERCGDCKWCVFKQYGGDVGCGYFASHPCPGWLGGGGSMNFISLCHHGNGEGVIKCPCFERKDK